MPLEKTFARICREVGATVRCNTKLRDMNIAVPAHDNREIEILASGLPMFQGAQLAVDVTMRCPLTTNGSACARAAVDNGAVLAKARRDKEAKYAELTNGARCRHAVAAIETGGRRSEEAVHS